MRINRSGINCAAFLTLNAIFSNERKSSAQQTTLSGDGKANPESRALVIPLKQVWTNGLIGTRDITDLSEQDKSGRAKQLFDGIADSLITGGEQLLRSGRKAQRGFAVEGEGLAALKEAHAVLVRAAKPRESFSPMSEITVIFFSYPRTSEVQLTQVELRGTKIDINYRFAGRNERNSTLTFAMIPVGGLPVGKHDVKLTQLPAVQKLGHEYKPTKPPLLVPSSDQYVSLPFSFEIEKSSK